MTIIPATPAHAADIAQLIMTAMTEDCCQYLAGKEHTLDDFYHMMLDLVLMDDSQYSWRNAFVAVDEEATEMDYSQIDDETEAGEFYLDSLAIYPEYRRRGIARQLLKRATEHAASLNLPAALLVDKGNPNAERLYRSVGFEYCNDAMWGGHEMRHLRCPIA